MTGNGYRIYWNAVEHIEKYAPKGCAAFSQDELIQTWLYIICKLSAKRPADLSAKFREVHPEVPWGEIIGLRNVLVHNYFEIDLEVAWGIVEHDVAR